MITFYEHERAKGLPPVEADVPRRHHAHAPLLMTALSACIGLLSGGNFHGDWQPGAASASHRHRGRHAPRARYAASRRARVENDISRPRRALLLGGASRMKTACLLVLMMSWATLTAVGEVAEPPVSTHRVARKSVLPKANLPKPPVNRRPRSLPGNSLHQGVPNKSGVGVTGGLIQGETIHNGLPVRTSGVVRPPRHRSIPCSIAGRIRRSWVDRCTSTAAVPGPSTERG